MKKKISHENYSNTVTYRIEAKESEYLYLEESQIEGAGKGLFTAIKIFKDDVIALFNGEYLTDDEAQNRSDMGEDSYFIGMLDGTTFDCMRVKGMAKYANDAQGLVKSNFKNNAMITFDEDDNVCIVAKRDIHSGEEIFCSYGAAYWREFKRNLKYKEQQIAELV